MKRRILRRPNRLAALILCLAVTLGLAACSSEAEYTAHDIKGVMPDLAFNLANENGESVDANDYEDVRLLFFGYTNCPDVCPATMARIRAAFSGLDEDQRKQVSVLFVSVDPKRDTPQRLKRFTSIFGPRFVGLTGTQNQLKALTSRYSVDYSYGEPNDEGFYKVLHSSKIFVFDPQGRMRLLVGQDETIDQLTHDLETLLERTG